MESPLFDTPIRDKRNSFAGEVLKELARFDEAFLNSRPYLPNNHSYSSGGAGGDENYYSDSHLSGAGSGAKERISRTLSLKRMQPPPRRKAIRFDAQDSEGKRILTSSASSVCSKCGKILPCTVFHSILRVVTLLIDDGLTLPRTNSRL